MACYLSQTQPHSVLLPWPDHVDFDEDILLSRQYIGSFIIKSSTVCQGSQAPVISLEDII